MIKEALNMEQGLEDLLTFFSCYRDSSTTKWDKLNPEIRRINERCLELFKKDYLVETIANEDGQYCATYPPNIIIVVSEKIKDLSDPTKLENIGQSIKDLAMQSRFARVRTRFPIPVIYLGGKNICRSSTLSQKLECALQNAANTIIKKMYGESDQIFDSVPQNLSSDERSLMERHRFYDIRLIEKLAVSHICDLMVEKAKKKYGVTVCSSEKNDRYNRYSKAGFKLFTIPYPGVEFFNNFNHEDPHSASKLFFDWKEIHNPATLQVENEYFEWADYQNWDLITLTKNYVQLLLHILCEDNGGLLIHCISGWDRTPLFICLLRLSLWADGLIHKSLSAHEIIYLVIAYDWMLFRHQFADRQTRGEDIFYFTFHVLDSLKGKEFSMVYIKQTLEQRHKDLSTQKDIGKQQESPVMSKRHSPNESIPDKFTFESSPNLRMEAERVVVPEGKDIACGSWQLMTFLDTLKSSPVDESAVLDDVEVFSQTTIKRIDSTDIFQFEEVLENSPLTPNSFPDILSDNCSNNNKIPDCPAREDYQDVYTRRVNLIETALEVFMKVYRKSIVPEAQKFKLQNSVWDWFWKK